MDKLEKRTLATAEVEIRSDEEAKQDYIVGYALKFNTESRDLGGFVEVIKPGAVDGVDLGDVRALFNHSPNQVLGRTKSGTLKLEVDEIGLRYTIFPPNTQFTRDLMESMKRGDIDSSSFGFTVDYANDGDSFEYNEERGVYVRSISKFKTIFDVSVVTYPAYQASESVVAQRSLDNYKSELEKAKKLKLLKLSLEI